jgi:hypothetical protein
MSWLRVLASRRYKRLLEQLEAIPSVRSASLSQTGLIGGGIWRNLIFHSRIHAHPGQRLDSTFSAVGRISSRQPAIPSFSVATSLCATTRRHLRPQASMKRLRGIYSRAIARWVVR